MEYLQVALTSLFSILVLFGLTKLMGAKQISQLSLFDYITGITIGSIAAEMATELEKNPLYPLLAMVVYGVASYLISIVTCYSVRLRRILAGKPLTLMNEGIIYRKNLRKARLDLGDFMTLLRAKGYFDPSQVQSAVLEYNGGLSILPRAVERPATPKDLKLTVVAEKIQGSVILDGQIMMQNLKAMGFDQKWLKKELKLQGFDDPKQVFFALCDSTGKLTCYPMTEEKPDEIFE